MGVPVKLSATPGAAAAPPPLLGEHTEEVLSSFLGKAKEEIGILRGKGVFEVQAECGGLAVWRTGG